MYSNNSNPACGGLNWIFNVQSTLSSSQWGLVTHGWPAPTCIAMLQGIILTSLSLSPGSNTHNNNAPGGDGQTGDAGEGTGGEYEKPTMLLVHPS